MSKTTYESLDNKIAASTLTKDLTKGLDVVDGHGIKKPGEYENPDELYDMLIGPYPEVPSVYGCQYD